MPLPELAPPVLNVKAPPEQIVKLLEPLIVAVPPTGVPEQLIKDQVKIT